MAFVKNGLEAWSLFLCWGFIHRFCQVITHDHSLVVHVDSLDLWGKPHIRIPFIFGVFLGISRQGWSVHCWLTLHSLFNFPTVTPWLNQHLSKKSFETPACPLVFFHIPIENGTIIISNSWFTVFLLRWWLSSSRPGQVRPPPHRQECTSPTSLIPWTRLARALPCRWACPRACWSAQPLEARCGVDVWAGGGWKFKDVQAKKSRQTYGIWWDFEWFWHVDVCFLCKSQTVRLCADGGSLGKQAWLWEYPPFNPYCGSSLYYHIL